MSASMQRIKGLTSAVYAAARKHGMPKGVAAEHMATAKAVLKAEMRAAPIVASQLKREVRHRAELDREVRRLRAEQDALLDALAQALGVSPRAAWDIARLDFPVESNPNVDAEARAASIPLAVREADGAEA